MPYVSLIDLIDNCPNQLEPNSIIVFDWCHWILQQIPDGITCEDMLSCIDCEVLLDILHFTSGFIVNARACTIEVDGIFINNSVISTFDCTSWELVIWTTTHNISCIADMFHITFMDGTNNYAVNNWDLIFVQGLDWLRFKVWPNLLQVGLPTWGTNSQVLTWNSTTNTAYRANPLDICCDQVIKCVQPYIDILQNQINIIAWQLCPCTWGGEWSSLAIYSGGSLVRSNVTAINFGTCLSASRDSHNNFIDVMFAPTVSFQCSPAEVGYIYTLQICDTEVDLSCIFTSIIDNLDVQFECVEAWNALILHVWGTDVDMTCIYGSVLTYLNVSFECVLPESQIPQYLLYIWGETIDLSCIYNTITNGMSFYCSTDESGKPIFSLETWADSQIDLSCIYDSILHRIEGSFECTVDEMGHPIYTLYLWDESERVATIDMTCIYDSIVNKYSEFEFNCTVDPETGDSIYTLNLFGTMIDLSCIYQDIISHSGGGWGWATLTYFAPLYNPAQHETYLFSTTPGVAAKTLFYNSPAMRSHTPITGHVKSLQIMSKVVTQRGISDNTITIKVRNFTQGTEVIATTGYSLSSIWFTDGSRIDLYNINLAVNAWDELQIEFLTPSVWNVEPLWVIQSFYLYIS